MRRMNPSLVTFAMVFVAAFASPASADIITINAAAYPLGTDLSAIVYPGLSLAKLSQSSGTAYNPTVSPVVTAPAWPNPDEPSMGATHSFYEFARCLRGSTELGNPCDGGYSVLELRFETPTNWVQLNSRFYSDAPFFIAYDALDNPISGYQVWPGQLRVTNTWMPVNGTGQENLVLSSDHRNIARIVYGGDNTVSPTEVSYKVPEPTTLGLMLLGIVGAGISRRRRTRADRRH